MSPCPLVGGGGGGGHTHSLDMVPSDPEFVNLVSSQGIDSQRGGPVRQPYLTYRPAWLHKLSESIPGLLKRLQIRAWKTNR
jgi:hypothetical protein